ncbi:MAG: hypothetical protein ACM3SX_17345 [Deltaproteobacteria bacterium]
MSLNSLATSRVTREATVEATGIRFSVASEDAVGPKQQDVQNALSALVEYVPAETVTLYLATISSLPVLTKSIPDITAGIVYAAYAVTTPILFLLIYGGKRRAAGQPRFPELKSWPWWPMTAATIAFLAWGIAVPQGPFVADESNRILAGLLAIIVSTLLGVAGRFFAPKPGELAVG